jgi:hypothetical protein
MSDTGVAVATALISGGFAIGGAALTAAVLLLSERSRRAAEAGRWILEQRNRLYLDLLQLSADILTADKDTYLEVVGGRILSTKARADILSTPNTLAATVGLLQAVSGHMASLLYDDPENWPLLKSAQGIRDAEDVLTKAVRVELGIDSTGRGRRKRGDEPAVPMPPTARVWQDVAPPGQEAGTP